MSDITQTSHGWLTPQELADARERMPFVYVQAVPVRQDHLGRITRVGLLLRVMPDGTVSRALVSGRVERGETLREALWRHLTKDLGSEADPQLPPSPTPFTVAEYFQDPERTGFHDPRQHAVALAYIVPVTGDCEPQQDALEFTWLSCADVLSPEVIVEIAGGHDRLVRLALASAQQLP